MIPLSVSSPSLLIIDAEHGIGPRLVECFQALGVVVTAYNGTDLPADVRCHEQTGSPPSSLYAIWESAGRFDVVLFNAPVADESSLLRCEEMDSLCRSVESDTQGFMLQLQEVTRLGMRQGGCQVWVMVWEDSFAYYLPTAFSPVSSHFRVGALRALAKEMANFSIAINAVVMQPVAEAIQERLSREEMQGLNTYAQKFKPIRLEDVCALLASWMGHPGLPMNGSVVHLGNGVYDGNY